MEEGDVEAAEVRFSEEDTKEDEGSVGRLLGMGDEEAGATERYPFLASMDFFLIDGKIVSWGDVLVM